MNGERQHMDADDAVVVVAVVQWSMLMRSIS